MKHSFFVLLAILQFSFIGCSQSPGESPKSKSTKLVGGRCEGCEAIHECPIPFGKLNNTDTLPDFNDKGPRLEISGIVYQRNGKTPARDVVIYVYHTDQTGNYPPGKNAKGWEKRHGYIRGWVKTNGDGFYKFYTLRPAAYPSRRDPQHIHVIIKEPGLNEYWIDEYLFEDDPLLTKKPDEKEARGGNGVIKVEKVNGIEKLKRDIILGLNIPDYPTSRLPVNGSGLASVIAILNSH
jgi:protocatechuate 3,4-dioxygenase, beta subunit